MWGMASEVPAMAVAGRGGWWKVGEVGRELAAGSEIDLLR